jgi:hypothetical protein
LLKRIGASRTASLAALLPLVASPVFYFSSHSARLDVATALASVLLLLAFVRMTEERSRWRYFLTGVFVALSVAVYVHVPTLIVLVWLYVIWRSRATAREWTISLAGAALALCVLIAMYSATTGELTLLGSGHNQYYSVASALPILHPFSWQVQKINTIYRFIQVWDTQWPLVILLAIACVTLVMKWSAVAQAERSVLAMSVLLILAWMLFEGPAVFYEIHASPALVLITAIGLSHLEANRVLISTVAIGVAATSMYAQRGYGEAGRILSLNNQGAVRSMLARVRSEDRPIVLADQPAWNIVASTPGVQLMTSHLLLFGGEPRPVAEILRAHNVQYLVLYSTKQFQSPFRPIADSLYQPVDMRVGDVTDEAKGYDAASWQVPDTVRLYRAKWLQ